MTVSTRIQNSGCACCRN